MIVRQLNRADAQAYQTLRLLALQESPSAFSASYEDEVGRSIDALNVDGTFYSEERYILRVPPLA